MEIRLDLHIHSALSPDGRMSPAEIVAAAKAKGLQGAAICDHDALCDAPCGDADFLLIRGEEFSTEYGHLLGLFLTAPVPPDSFAGLVAAIHAQGGLAVLAHPFERDGDPDRLAPVLPLLDGLEVWNGRANRKRSTANAEAEALCARTGLPRFAGSDAHVAREIGNGTVTVTVDALTVDAVKAALLRPDNPVAGVEGRRLDVARSQHTKLNKTGAGLKKRLAWLLFAAKCLWEDKVSCR